MKGSRFDDLARSLATVPGDRSSRRELIRALGLGGAAAIATTYAVQDRAAIAADAAVPAGPSVAQLAFDLAYDVNAIFAFVRDEIRYDPYPGALRGATGTLWGLAGNAVDQALLLAALLAESQVTTRFAVGKLDDAAAERLLATARDRDATTVRADLTRLLRFDNPGTAVAGAASSTPAPNEQARLNELGAAATGLLNQARTWIADAIDTVEGALTDAKIELPKASVDLPARERAAHVWVQYASGPGWVDLDPVFPDAVAGRAVAGADTTYDALADDLFHTVTIRAVAQTAASGQAAKTELFSYAARTVDLVGVPMTFMHVAPQSLKAAGIAISGIIEGTTQYLPFLIVGDQNVSGGSLTFNTGPGALDSLGGGPPDGEAIAEWLEVEIAGIDRPVQVARREVFDRRSPQQRADSADLAELPPIELTDLEDGSRGYLPLLALTVLVVTGHEVPGSALVPDLTQDQVQPVMALPLLGQHYVRTGLAADQLTQRGYRFVPDGANVTALKLVPRTLGQNAAEGAVIIDLMRRNLTALPLAGTAPSPSPGPYAGALVHAAERFVLEGAALAAAGAAVPLPTVSVGRLFEVAKQTGVPIRTLLPGAQLPGELDVSARAGAAIGEALAAGLIVIVPERGIVLNGEPVTGWWEVDPATGETNDRLETGMGAVALATSEEDTFIIVRVGVNSSPAYKQLGLCILFVAIGTVVTFSSVGALVGLEVFGGGTSSAERIGLGLLGMAGVSTGVGGLLCGGW